MKNFLSVFSAFPAILQAVQAVETAVPLPKSGQQKLNLVMGAAAAAWEISQEVGQAQQQVSKGNAMNSIMTMTNLAVATLNAAGVFKSATPVSSN